MAAAISRRVSKRLPGRRSGRRQKLPQGGSATTNPLPADAVSEVLAGIEAADIPQGARDFVGKLWPHAMAASRETGIPAHFMIAQAALETGWGKAELKHAGGQPSYNLFNIKAGRSWAGETVALDALEYSNGKAIREPSRFRSYGSYAEAFRDYARLLKDNPRYAEVLGQQDASGFARSCSRRAMPPTRCTPTNSLESLAATPCARRSAARFLSTWQRFCFGLTVNTRANGETHHGRSSEHRHHRTQRRAVGVGHHRPQHLQCGHRRLQPAECGAGHPAAAVFGGSFFGQGTQVESVRRSYNAFLEGQVLTADSQRAQFATYSTQIAQLDNLLADPDTGLSPALQSFFDGVQEVSANPSSVPARQSMISAAQSLVATFQYLDGRMSEIRDGIEGQIGSTVAEINAYASEIADINQRIAVTESAGTGQQANDLRDQRDTLIRELNGYVKLSTVTESDGSVSVFVGSGQPLVIGTNASTLVTLPSRATRAARPSPCRRPVAAP